MAATAPAAASTSLQSGTSAGNPVEAAVSPTVASESISASATPSTSASQLAAQEVLAGKATVARSVNTDFDALGAALSRGAGVPGNPIVVTLNEREQRAFHDEGVATNLLTGLFSERRLRPAARQIHCVCRSCLIL